MKENFNRDNNIVVQPSFVPVTDVRKKYIKPCSSMIRIITEVPLMDASASAAISIQDIGGAEGDITATGAKRRENVTTTFTPIEKYQ